MAAKTFELWWQNFGDAPEDERESSERAWNAAWNAAEEKFNSAPSTNQQLKAEIAALVKELCDIAVADEIYKKWLESIIDRMRQLSSV